MGARLMPRTACVGSVRGGVIVVVGDVIVWGGGARLRRVLIRMARWTLSTSSTRLHLLILLARWTHSTSSLRSHLLIPDGM